LSARLKYAELASLITSHEERSAFLTERNTVLTQQRSDFEAELQALLETGCNDPSLSSNVTYQWRDCLVEEAASVMSLTRYVGLPAKRIVSALTGSRRQTAGDIIQDMPDFNVFYRYAANFPWRSHASWFITQMYRWGQVKTPINFQQVIEKAYRPDIFRDVANLGGHIYPMIDTKIEGDQIHPWVLSDASSPIALGPNQSIDCRVFRYSDPIAYIEGFQRHCLRLSLSKLAEQNK